MTKKTSIKKLVTEKLPNGSDAEEFYVINLSAMGEYKVVHAVTAKDACSTYALENAPSDDYGDFDAPDFVKLVAFPKSDAVEFLVESTVGRCFIELKP